MTSPISQVHAWLAAVPASSGSPVWGVIAALGAVVVVALLILAVVGRRPRHLIVYRQWPGRRTARDTRIKRAAAADVQALRGDAKLVSPDAPGAHDDEL